MCEWNPVKHQPAYDPPIDGDCDRPATLVVGRKWHLCELCATDRRFIRMKKRPLRELEETDG